MMSRRALARSSSRVTSLRPYEIIGSQKRRTPCMRSRAGAVQYKRKLFSCTLQYEDKPRPESSKSRYDDTIQTRLAHRARQKQADKVGHCVQIVEKLLT